MFANVLGNFKRESHRYTAVKKILNANYQEQQLKLRLRTTLCHKLKNEIINKHRCGAYKLMETLINKQLSTECWNSLETKNKNISQLHVLPKRNCVRWWLLCTHYQLDRPWEFESLFHRVGYTVEPENLEDFHHFLRTSTNTYKKRLQNTGQHLEIASGSIGESRHCGTAGWQRLDSGHYSQRSLHWKTWIYDQRRYHTRKIWWII